MFARLFDPPRRRISFRRNQCSLTSITANNELGKYDLSPYGHDLQLVYLISATFSTEVLSYRVQSGIWAKTSFDFAIAGLFHRVLPKRVHGLDLGFDLV